MDEADKIDDDFALTFPLFLLAPATQVQAMLVAVTEAADQGRELSSNPYTEGSLTFLGQEMEAGRYLAVFTDGSAAVEQAEESRKGGEVVVPVPLSPEFTFALVDHLIRRKAPQPIGVVYDLMPGKQYAQNDTLLAFARKVVAVMGPKCN